MRKPTAPIRAPHDPAPLAIRLWRASWVEHLHMPGITTPCRSWLLAKERSGHGVIRLRDSHGKHRSHPVHRVAWEMYNGPIPDGFRLMHTCRNRACWNPEHLDLVSSDSAESAGVSERLWQYTRVEHLHMPGIASPCHTWTGALNEFGYGRISVRCPDGKHRPRKAHRVAYELFVGPIPDDLQIDHLCRNRACWNPEHLEPVTSAENTRRGISWTIRSRRTHCPEGHPYSGANLRIHPGGWRICRECENEDRRRVRNNQRRRCGRPTKTGAPCRQWCRVGAAACHEHLKTP